MLTDEFRYKIIKLIEVNPSISQRQLADALGISLGKVNYCLRALIDKGVIKANNFRNSKKKRAYLYKLTPKGIEEKASVTARFLRKKLLEYEHLEEEIRAIREDLKSEKESESKFSS